MVKMWSSVLLVALLANTFAIVFSDESKGYSESVAGSKAVSREKTITYSDDSDPVNCTGPHEYFSCGGACDNVCETLNEQNQTSCPIIMNRCNQMCYCEDGYARNYEGICIPIPECPSNNNTTEPKTSEVSPTSDKDGDDNGDNNECKNDLKYEEKEEKKCAKTSHGKKCRDNKTDMTTSTSTKKPTKSTTPKHEKTKKPKTTTTEEPDSITEETETPWTTEEPSTQKSTTKTTKTYKSTTTPKPKHHKSTTTESTTETEKPKTKKPKHTTTKPSTTEDPTKCTGKNEVYHKCAPSCPQRSCSDYLNGSNVCFKLIDWPLKCKPECRCIHKCFRGAKGDCKTADECKQEAKEAKGKTE